MRVDHEAVLQDLKKHLQSKDSHGRRELLQTIGELEAKHGVEEGTVERALRVAGNTISTELLRYGQQPSSSDIAGDGTNGRSDQPLAETQ